MKIFYRLLCLLALTGLAGNIAVSAEPQSDGSVAPQKSIAVVQREMTACIAAVNKTEDAKYVDINVIAITPGNPNTAKLFSSNDLISDQQAVELQKFKDLTLQCRDIAKELPNRKLVEIYEYYYSKIDDVYSDLVNKKITIGVANQERQMRIHYANEKWLEIMKAEKQG